MLREATDEGCARSPSWAAVFALVAAAASMTGCGSTGDSSAKSYNPTEYPVGHPCRTGDACTEYIQLPDGGAIMPPLDAGPSPGQARMCGPCNG